MRLLLLVFAIPIAATVALNSGFGVRSRVGELAALIPPSPLPQVAAVPTDPVMELALIRAIALPAGWGTSALVAPATIAYLIPSDPAPDGVAVRHLGPPLRLPPPVRRRRYRRPATENLPPPLPPTRRRAS